MSENLNKFKQVLNQLFEMDKADLDFGIYRIINQKRNEINNFLDNDLLPQVRDELSLYENKDEAKVKQELNELTEQAEKLGADPNSMPKIKELRKRLSQSTDIASLESEVFSYLTTFFSRYYDKGDFISKRRYKEGVYAIPYEGEEVKLYWANHDQYYIKTTENLNNYTFKAGSKKVHFRLVHGEQTKDNIKSGEEKNRKFVLDEEKSYEILDNEFIIYFNYKSDTRSQTRTKSTKRADFPKFINVSIALELLGNKSISRSYPELANVITSSAIPDLTLLEKHLNDYTAKNSFDYFIHKDLGGFLRRELDFFIKNEVMHIDDLDTEHELEVQQYLSKIKVIKRIGHKIIAFLEQLENFQKKLWLKKKFVVKSQWCLTLDRVPEVLYPEIIKNKEQIEEWKRLFAIDEMTEPPVLKKEKKAKKKVEDDEDSLFDENGEPLEDVELIDEGDGDTDEPPATFVPYSDPLTVEFLKANPFLVLDTRFFNLETKWKILSSVNDIDSESNGLLINSENFQALGLLQEKYREKIKCVYIDPPYNAKSSEILYKNTFKHSSWLSLIQNRLSSSKTMLAEPFVYVIAIDEVENSKLHLMLTSVFSNYEDACISIVHNPTGQQGNNFSFTHEFAHFIFPENVNCIGLEDRDDSLRESEPDIRPLRNVSSGVNHLRTSAANCFYPIIIKSGKIIGFGEVSDENYHPESINIKRKDGTIEVYPIDPSNVESKWVFARNTVESIKNELTAVYDKKKDIWDIIREKKKFRYKSLWEDKRYSANSWGSVVLNNIINDNPFLYPKSIFTVRDCVDAALNNSNAGNILDYFAGSGTTGHAVINLNREDGGSRKYILVEMGQYFDTVLKLRIQKVIYSKDWKDGKPVSRKGSSHIFKYMSLESYDDTLNNLAIEEKVLLKDLPVSAREDYMLKYMLDLETKDSASLLNIESIKNPFDYSLKIIHDNELVNETIDLVETFNYLLGLSVKQYHVPVKLNLAFERTTDKRLEVVSEKGKEIFTFQALEGTTRDNETVIVFWRVLSDDVEKDDAALRYFVKKFFDLKSYGQVYVNGDCTIQDARLTEEHFKKLMFDVQDV